MGKQRRVYPALLNVRLFEKDGEASEDVAFFNPMPHDLLLLPDGMDILNL